MTEGEWCFVAGGWNIRRINERRIKVVFDMK